MAEEKKADSAALLQARHCARLGTEDSVNSPSSPEGAEDPRAAGWFSRLLPVSRLSWGARSTAVSRTEAVTAPIGLSI